MKTQLNCLLSLLLAGWALGAHAQSVWTYEIIGTDNQIRTIGSQPRGDISYPPGNAPASIRDASEKQLWVPMTAREEAERMSAPKLIILLGRGSG